MSIRWRSGFRRWIRRLSATAVALLSIGAAQAEGDELDRLALARILNPPLGLPPVPVPEENPATIEKIRLGRKLFLDRRLSHNGTLSCAMCHVPEQGFTVNEIRTAVGKEGTSLRRNAPTMLNVAFVEALFHDGREPTLDLQAFDVFLNANEMAAPSLGAVVAKVASLPGYRVLFWKAFQEPPTVETIGQALGSYLRTLLAADSSFDRWFFGNEEEAMSASAQRGFGLFSGRGGCTVCHLVGEDHALFTDQRFHDTGLGWYNSMIKSKSSDPVDVEIAPGVFTRIDRSVVESVGDPTPPDLGRYEVTLDPKDRWLFKTPSLRNVSLTAPYMHDGSFSSLRQVLEFYNKGGHRHPGVDPAVRPLDLDEEQIQDLEAFLESLTAARVGELIRDARSERVGNPGDLPP